MGGLLHSGMLIRPTCHEAKAEAEARESEAEAVALQKHEFLQ